MKIPNGYIYETKKGLRMYMYGKWYNYNPKDKRINRKMLKIIEQKKESK